MIPEGRLRQAAQRAQEALLDSLPESPAAHTFSPAYRRKLDRLARRVDGKARPPRWILHRVAGILLAVVCLGGVVLGTNAQAREAVFGWVRRQVEDAQRYFYQGDPTASSAQVRYQITVPEGYWLEDALEMDGYYDYYYLNEEGQSVEFTYQYVTKQTSGTLYVDDQEAERKEIQLHGNPADLYLSYEAEASNTVIWTDEEAGVLFDVTAFLDEEALISLAESVALVES